MKIEKILTNIIILVAILTFIFLIKSILTPFILSAIIAYLLNPVIDKLQKIGLSRSISSLFIVIIFISAILIIFTKIIPILIVELADLVTNLPIYFDNIKNNFLPKFLLEQDLFFESNLKNIIDGQNISNILSFSDNILGNITYSTNIVIGLISLVSIIPFISFYFLRDWHLIIKSVKNYLPKNHKNNIINIFIDIDKIISKYLRGQLMVCSILGIVYGIALHYSELHYGFLIGIITGILSFIPFVGMIIGVITAYIIAIFQWGFSLSELSMIGFIFIFGQLLESNYLTPKLVGKEIGIHPVWIVFGLFVFAVLFGFVGILIAIPLTAISKILITHFINKHFG
jgi:predicted PurR-regulated permease PerM